MRKMKDSGIEWIGEIPEDWEIFKVSKNYKIQTGFTPDTENSSYYDENGEIWISIADMSGKKYVSESSKKISQIYLNKFNPKKVKEGSLLYSFKLSAGKVCFAQKDLYTNEAIASFESSEKSYLPFLYYSAPVFIEKNANENIYGAKLLNQKLILSAKIIYPPIENQIKISNFLDKKCNEIEGLIKIQEQEIEKLEEYKKSVIYEAVTKGLDPKAKMKDSGIEWIGEIPENFNITKLKYKCEIKTGNSIPDEAKDSYVYTEDSIPYISTKDITLNSNQINYSTGIHINSNDKRFKFSKKDSVLLCIEGGSAGKKVGFTNQEVAFVNKLASIYSNSEINRFIFYSIQSRIFENQFFSEVEGLIGGVGLSDIREFFILSPPLEIQSKISYYLDKKCKEIDTLISKKQEKIEKLEEYKKSVIYECVTGKREV